MKEMLSNWSAGWGARVSAAQGATCSMKAWRAVLCPSPWTYLVWASLVDKPACPLQRQAPSNQASF